MCVRNVQTEREIFLTEKTLKDIFIIVASTENSFIRSNHLLLLFVSNRSSILCMNARISLLYFLKSFVIFAELKKEIIKIYY